MTSTKKPARGKSYDGFTDEERAAMKDAGRANLDDGAMRPVAYALPELTAADEQRISALVQQAVS